MAQPEVQGARGVDRRIRHEARDGLSVAAVSLGISVLLTLALGVTVWWLG